MLKRIFLKTTVVVALAASAVLIPACQSTPKAQPEMLTGDAQVAHERHDTGIDSHTAD
jgi:CBS-domain-containing membrane protein